MIAVPIRDGNETFGHCMGIARGGPSIQPASPVTERR